MNHETPTDLNPRKHPLYQKMLDHGHWTGKDAEPHYDNTILIDEQVFEGFNQHYDINEIVDLLNDDINNPSTCRWCNGAGWKDSVPCRMPCPFCQKGQKEDRKLRGLRPEDIERQKSYLRTKLDKLTRDYAKVEQELIDLEEKYP